MTCKEKLALEHPDKIGVQYTADHYGCPFDYGYLAKEHCDCRDVTSCAECWDREIPEIQPSLVDEDDQELKELSNGFFKGSPEPHILDSGNRTEFSSGAVRDMREGKGRCDLLPLDIIAEYTRDPIFYEIANFQMTGDVNCLYRCITYFEPNWDDGKSKASEDDIYKQRMYTGFLEVAKQFEEGAKKYGDDNWKKGMPVRVFIDSAVRHYLKFLRGDKDEPHNRAFCWNIMCAIWTCKHKPELNDYACDEEESK